MEEIKNLMDNFKGETYDFCFEILKRYGERPEIFEYVCKNYKRKPKNGTIPVDQYFSKTEIDEYKSVYGDTVNGLLNSNIKKCNFGLIEPNNFYTSLWDSFCANFASLKERAFAFYYTIIDATIPYQYLGKPISMSNERFKEIIDKNEASINKIKYIAKSGYTQRTEEASLLLNCLEELEDFESKVVVLAQGMSLLNKPSVARHLDLDTLIKQIDKKIEELESQESGEA